MNRSSGLITAGFMWAWRLIGPRGFIGPRNIWFGFPMDKGGPEPARPPPTGPTGGGTPGLNGGRADMWGMCDMGGTGGTGFNGVTEGTGGRADTGGGTGMGGILGIGGIGFCIVGRGGMGGGTEFSVDIAVVMVDPMVRLGLLKLLVKLGGMFPMLGVAKVDMLLLLAGSCVEAVVATVVGVGLLKPCIVVGKLPLPPPPELVGGPGLLPFPAGPSRLPVSKRLRLSSIIFCISVLLLSKRDTFDPLMVPPVRIMPSLASSSVAKTIKASPCSPPTICTPPSGMVNPEKKWRMSMVPATMGRPCKRMTTAMLRRTNTHLQVKEGNVWVRLQFATKTQNTDT